MTLTALLILLKLVNVYIAPANPLAPNDQALATCIVQAMTARPTALVLVRSADDADVILTIADTARHPSAKYIAGQLRVNGTLTTRDGTTLITTEHNQKGFNHALCHQAEGLIEKMAKQLHATVHE